MALRKKAVQCAGIDADSYYTPSTSSRRTKTPERSRGHHVTWQDTATIAPRNDEEAFPKRSENSSSPTSVLDSNEGRSPPSFSPVTSGPQIYQHHDASSHSSYKMKAPHGRESVSSSSNAGVLAAITNKVFPPGDGRSSMEPAIGSQGIVHDSSTLDQKNRLHSPTEVLKTIDIQREKPVLTRQSIPPPSSEDYSSMGSESELGSMSTEFDAVLAAAVAAGVRNSSASHDTIDERSVQHLAGIEEEPQYSHGHFPITHENVPDADKGGRRGEHLVTASTTAPSVMMQPTRSTNLQETDTIGSRSINQGQISETFHGSSRREQPSESVLSQSRSSSSRRVENNDTVPSRGEIAGRLSVSNSQERGADVGAIVPWMGDQTVEQSSISSTRNATVQQSPPPKRVTLARIRREKLLSKASAWQKAKTSKIDNRYKREESKIQAWEDHQNAKASIILKKAEMELEKKRAKAVEKMQNEIARARKKVEDQKAAAYAKREEKVAKVVEEAEIIKKTGRVPIGCFPF